MQFESLLVAIDGSHPAELAAHWAAANLSNSGALVLMTVNPTDTVTRAGPQLRDTLVKAHANLAISIKNVPDSDDVADALTTAAHATACDAVVLGARHHESWHPRRLSPTAAHLHHLSQLVVINVREPQTVGNSIVVAVDGTDASWDVLRWAASRTRPDDQLTAVWILDEPTSEYAQMPVTAGMKVTERAVTAYLQQEVDAIASAANRSISALVEVGYVRRDLIRVADDGDVLVVGHGHHSLFGRAVGESVSTAMLHRFDRTTIVVPPG